MTQTVWMTGLSLRGSKTSTQIYIWIHSGMPFGALKVFQAFENKRFVLLDYLKSNEMKTRCLCVFCIFSRVLLGGRSWTHPCWLGTHLEAEEQPVDLKQTTARVPAEDKYTNSDTYSNGRESVYCMSPRTVFPTWGSGPHKGSQHESEQSRNVKTPQESIKTHIILLVFSSHLCFFFYMNNWIILHLQAS